MIKKDLEYIFKKLLFSESYLLKRRLKRAIFKKYEKELEIIEKFSDHNKEAVDIGVYRGVYSYQLSKYFKHVYSFEPNTLIFDYLSKNLTKIIKNISLFNIALSNEDGNTELKIPIRNKSIFNNNNEELFKLGAASIHPLNNFKEFKAINVKKKKLDDILNDKKISFIKIDVEGHEKEVIDGSIQIINNYRPTLLVEIEERHSGKKVTQTLDYINNLGYKSYYYDEGKINSTSNLNNFKKYNNYIFIKKD